eukprot:TRINITY_DN1643_c0_g1_i5.p1 TRINITY_DN1643_c0_g1~~TRINITY_DN1643_c0_g1_i5.p1  ORF type:complete len:203 (-),score=48.59 TRINITY_DN1643_c0_g1_i5:213-821(-)
MQSWSLFVHRARTGLCPFSTAPKFVRCRLKPSRATQKKCSAFLKAGAHLVVSNLSGNVTPDEIQQALLFSGFVELTTEGEFVIGRKPDWKVGTSSELRKKSHKSTQSDKEAEGSAAGAWKLNLDEDDATVGGSAPASGTGPSTKWVLSLEDAGAEELEDEDMLLGEEDKAKPDRAGNNSATLLCASILFGTFLYRESCNVGC